MRVVFMGTPIAAVASLEALRAGGHDIVAVYTQPDKPAGRGNKIAPSPIKQAAIEHGLPVCQPLRIKTPEALEEFRSHAADVAVVVAYGRILPQTFLEAFPGGAINVHFSLLPKYRGAAPVNWAIVNGEEDTGVTTMQMDAGLDTGAILLQRSTPIGRDESAIELMTRLAEIGADLLIETLAGRDHIAPIPQNDERASFAPIMRREDGLIDWQMTAEQIANRVRGFQPFPTTFTYLDGAKLTLWRAHTIKNDVNSTKIPGSVIEAGHGSLTIQCGNGTRLGIDEVQPEGKRRMPVRDFLNGSRIKIGDSLGG